MEEDKVENPPVIKSSATSDDGNAGEKCPTAGSSEDHGVREEVGLPISVSCFKVPSDVALARPIFTKVPKKSAAAVDKAAEEAPEERSPAEVSRSQCESVVKSPAQQLVEKSVPLPYKEPPWSGLPKHDYSFEILKNGIIVGAVPLDKPFIVIGRLAQCDVVMEHPSLSRFHCVVQYRAESTGEDEEGFYAYDLESTHGSFHNKHRMKPHTYYRLRVGHMIKFGGSSRMLILQGPNEDQEPELDLTVTELKARAAERAEKLHRLETGEMEDEDRDPHHKEDTSESDANQGSHGIDWGMGEDAEEDEAEDGENPFATLNEDLYLNDPKKTLRGWFEREGYDLPEYVAEDVSPGVYKCKVELPIPGPGGGPLVAIAEHRGRKKAVVIQCALEACRLLDKQGVLRQAKHESHEKKRKDWAKNDYYDSDEDDFLDRTGDVQRKRLRRMKTAKGSDLGAETYESLMRKYREVTDELSSLEQKLAEAERVKREAEVKGEDEDDLDSFMKNLKSQVPDKHKRVNWKLRAVDLRKEELRLRRLANVAKPFDKPELQPYVSDYEMKPNLPAKHPCLRQSDATREAESLLKKPKDVIRKVHKAFLEEEPETKVKLRRLDDKEEEELMPIPYKGTKPKPRKSTLTKEGARRVPSPGANVGDGRREREEAPEATASRDVGRRGGSTEEPSKATTERDELGGDRLPTIVAGLKPTVVAEVKGPETLDVGIRLPEEGDDPSDAGMDEKESHKGKRKSHILGPTLPTHQEFLKVMKQDPLSKVKTKSAKKSGTSYDTDVISKYETWVPPSDQTGDGRTSLNEKYGY